MRPVVGTSPRRHCSRSSLASPASAQAPPPWKQGQPADMADSTLAPIAQPPAPKAPGEIPVDKIKVPPGFKVGAVGARDQQRPRHDLGRQGHAVRQQPRGRQRLRGGGQGRPARGEGDRQGPQPAQRRRLQGRHALRRGDLADHQDGGHRGQARQPAGHGSGLRHRCRAIRRTAGSTWPSGRTASSTSTSARPATSASRPTPTPTSRA